MINSKFRRYVYLLLICLILSCFSKNLLAADYIELSTNTATESYEIQTKDKIGKYFDKSDDDWWQGTCIADKYIIICAVNTNNNNKGHIYVFDKNSTNKAPKCKIATSGHHCNSVTYDSKRQLVVIAEKEKAPIIFKLDISTGKLTKQNFTFTQTVLSKNGVNAYPSAIAYDPTSDQMSLIYIGSAKYFVYSSDLFYNNSPIQNAKEYACNIIEGSGYHQQATAYNGFLYHVIDVKENNNWVNYVFIYDLLDNGRLVNRMRETNSTLEMEAVCVDPENNYIYASWHRHNGTRFKKYALYKTKTDTSIFKRTTVNFDGNGGNNANSIIRYFNSDSIGTLPASSRNGYTFNGWYTDKVNGEKINEATIITNDVTYYAHWTPISYSISYNLDGGNCNNVSTYNIESDNIKINNPTKEGYDFIGWTGSNGEAPLLDVIIVKGSTGDKKYIANWKLHEYNNEKNNPELENGNNPTIQDLESDDNKAKQDIDIINNQTNPDSDITGNQTNHDSDITGNQTNPDPDITGNQTGNAIDNSQNKTEQDSQKNDISQKDSTIDEDNKIVFYDVDYNSWYYEYVMFSVKNKIFNGISKTEFGPTLNMTRGMLVTVLYRLSASSEKEYSSFDDVSRDKYYSNAIAWAAKNSIVNGIGNNKFAPDIEISREDLATIIYRYIISNKININTENSNIVSYFDESNISNYAKEGVKYLSQKGLMNGKSYNMFDAKGITTRAEVATLLTRLIKKYDSK